MTKPTGMNLRTFTVQFLDPRITTAIVTGTQISFGERFVSVVTWSDTDDYSAVHFANDQIARIDETLGA